MELIAIVPIPINPSRIGHRNDAAAWILYLLQVE